MKLIKYLFLCSLVTVLAVSCYKGIDDITPVAAGSDVADPELVINYPEEGKLVRLPDEIGTIIFKLTASDDIELKSVTLQLDGSEIGSISSFKDYRRADISFEYTNLLDGDHTLTVIVLDLTGKSVTKTVTFRKITAEVYNPLEGEVLYFGFEGSNLDLISGNAATVTGSPGFSEGKLGDAYTGAADAYLEYPADGLLGEEFSVAFWYKINAEPTRGGVVAISPPGEDRTTGLRLFREGNATEQKLGLNFGIGSAEVWINPFITLPPDEDWMHVAITISTTLTTIYVNGEVISETEIEGAIDWTGCTSITIASGMPNFVYWEHFSDLSLYDEMHFFSRAINAAEVQGLFAVK